MIQATSVGADLRSEHFQVLCAELAAKVGIDATEVDPDRDFASYGLDSIDAVLVGSSVGEKLNLALPPELFLHHRTLNEVFAALTADSLSVEAQGPSAPARQHAFLCPGAWGYGYRNKEFTALCEDFCDLEQISITGWREWVADDLRFETLVEQVCEQVQQSVPEGPVRLAGYSQGGLLAFAAMIALRRQARQVASLSIFDSVADVALLKDEDRDRHVVVKLFMSAVRAVLFQATRGLGPLAFTGATPGETRVRLFFQFRRACAMRPQAWKSLLRLLAARGGLMFKGRGGVNLEKFVRLQLFGEMWRRWRLDHPQVADGRGVVLFRSEQEGPPDLGWSQLCDGFATVAISGQHDTIFDEAHVTSLAASFVRSLSPMAAE